MISKLVNALGRLMLALPLCYLLVIYLPQALNHSQQTAPQAATSRSITPITLPPPAPKQKPKPVTPKQVKTNTKPQPLALSPTLTQTSTVVVEMAPIALIEPRLTQLTAPPLTQGLASLQDVDSPPKLLHYVAPQMPVAARSQGIAGKVTLRLVVSETGEVMEAEVQAAEPEHLFDQAALTAAKRWRFKPAEINQQAVSVYVDVPINFQLN